MIFIIFLIVLCLYKNIGAQDIVSKIHGHFQFQIEDCRQASLLVRSPPVNKYITEYSKNYYYMRRGKIWSWRRAAQKIVVLKRISWKSCLQQTINERRKNDGQSFYVHQVENFQNRNRLNEIMEQEKPSLYIQKKCPEKKRYERSAWFIHSNDNYVSTSPMHTPNVKFKYFLQKLYLFFFPGIREVGRLTMLKIRLI